jgi:PEGA domain.
MKKTAWRITAIFLVGFIMTYISACQSLPNPVDYVVSKGGIAVASNPPGAKIWVDGVYTGKVTPDSIISIELKNYNVKLTCFGYTDTAFTVSVILGNAKQSNVDLTTHKTLNFFTNTVLYQTDLTEEKQPGGIILSTGASALITGPEKAKVDFFYLKDASVFISPDTIDHQPDRDPSSPGHRTTYFFWTQNTNLTDSLAPPPLNSPYWINFVPDTLKGYFYAYDADKHYSKLKISSSSKSVTGDTAWVKLTGYYNITAENDVFK